MEKSIGIYGEVPVARILFANPCSPIDAADAVLRFRLRTAECTKVVYSDEFARRKVHQVEVGVCANSPSTVAIQSPIAGGHIVMVSTQSSVVARMEPVGGALQTAYGNGWWQNSVERCAKTAGVELPLHIEVGDLAPRMDAGIRAARADDTYRQSEGGRGSVLDFLLDGGPIGLRLPAAEGSAVIFDDHPISGHESSNKLGMGGFFFAPQRRVTYLRASTAAVGFTTMVFPTRIYLTGFMGSGKSTVGPLLAERLGYAFIDLDALVEASAGIPIRQIFAEQGEHEFRRLESLMLRSASRTARVVIALGGGAITSENNLYFVVTNGTLVYLSVEPAILARRLQAINDTRPLLLSADGQSLSESDLTRRVEALVEERRDFYNRAHVAVDVGRLDVDAAVDAVVAALVEEAA